MTVVVRDLVPAFLEFWTNPNRQWDEYAGQHPEVLNDFTRTGRTLEPERLEKALATYPELEARIRANAPHATRWIEEAAARVVPVLEAEHVDIHGVAMVGLGTSNGWVDNGTLYLAVEMIPDERSAEILAAHEIAHALQLPLPEHPWPDDGPLGQSIYSEGFATALTAELFPQYDLAEHLWFGPGYDDWLADCESRRQEAEAAILADLDSEDDAVSGRYLTMSGQTGFPKRIGYFVGTRLIQALRREHTWPELARWSTDRAMDEVRARLSA
ncbi:hypothetical protein ACIBG5_03340 [Kribbella sp. NPDC050241]|uniref:hypothetical protein n=1 Tax=Kribbella sp. NPDC050241 TaxID=3364115 RepID=UPI0037B50249